jgi:predicted dehydrogenase
MIKIGIIGVGGVATSHAKELEKIKEVSLVAVYDVISDNAEALASQFSARVYKELPRLFDAVDAVFILTPPFAHKEPVVAAAKAGKHILLEKPISLSLADADEMIDAVKEAGVKFMVGFNFRYQAPFRKMAAISRAGDLGELVYAWAKIFNYYPTSGWEERRRQNHWRMTMKDSGGRISEFATHSIDWLVSFAGQAKRVFAKATTAAEGLEVDDTDIVIMDFAQGMGKVEIALTAQTIRERSFGILGKAAGLLYDGKTLWMRRKDDEAVEVETGSCPSRQEHFIKCILEDKDPIPGAEDARHNLQIVLASYESAKKGRPVKI